MNNLSRIMSRPRLVLSIVFALGVMLLLGISASPAQAIDINCGDVVTGHVVLHEDLNCVDSPGLIVNADGTTIDLNGWAINCTGGGYLGSCQTTTLAPAYPGYTGIDTNGKNNVLIKGPGTINGFHFGVHVNGGSNINVKDLFLTGPVKPAVVGNPRGLNVGINVTGTECPDPVDTIVNIHGNEVENHSDGIGLHGADCVNVGYNIVHDNNSDPFECHGIHVAPGSNNNINNNEVFRNGENAGIDSGMTIQGASSTNNTVVHNNVHDNFGDGISVRFGATNIKITKNQSFNPAAVVGFFFDMAERGAPGNKWNKNNTCATSLGEATAACPP